MKDIDRQNYNDEESSSVTDENKDSDFSYVEDAKREEKVKESNVPIKVAVNDTTNSKDIPDFETLKKTEPIESPDETRLIDDQLDSSKFDEVVEDRQYVEVPVIKEEISKQTEDSKLVPTVDTAKVKDSIETPKETPISKIISETVKEAENLEIMHAEARHLAQRQVMC